MALGEVRKQEEMGKLGETRKQEEMGKLGETGKQEAAGTRCRHLNFDI